MGAHNGETEEYGASADTDSGTAASRRRYLTAFWITVAVVAVVVAMLPMALASMVDDLRGQDVSAVYDLFTGMDINADQTFAAATAFVNTKASQSTRWIVVQLSCVFAPHRGVIELGLAAVQVQGQGR